MSRSFRCSEAQWAFGMAVIVTIVYAFLVATQNVHALAPYGSYEQVFQYADGQISVNQTAQLMLHDNEPGGNLNVGEYVVRVQSLPPRLLYRAREVGRIPKSVTLHTEEVCLVTSRGDAEQIRAERDRANKEAEAASAGGRRLLSFVSDYDLDSEGYAQAQFYKKVCPAYTWFQWDTASRALVGDGVFRQKITDLYNNLLTKDVAVSKSAYMRRIKNHVAGYNGVLLDGWLQRDAVMAELVLITQMYVDVLTPEQSQWRINLGCYNMMGRCYSYRFTSMEMSQPGEACRTANPMPSGCKFEVYWREKHMNYVSFVHRDNFNAVIENQAACKSYMNDAETLGGGGGSALHTFDKGDMADLFLDAFGMTADAYRQSVEAAIKDATAASQWAKDVGLALDSAKNLTAEQGKINNKVEDLMKQLHGNQESLLTVQRQALEAQTLFAELSYNTTEQFNKVIENNKIRMLELSENTNLQIQQKFDYSLKAVADVTTIQSGQFQQLHSNILAVSDMLQAVNAQLTAYIQQKQYNRLMTASFYSSLVALEEGGSGEVALVSGDGNRPQRLSGNSLKAYIDHAVIVYNNTGSSVVRSIAVTFFADAHIMLNTSRSWTTVDQMIAWMGVRPCIVRADLRSVTTNCTASGANCTSTLREWDHPFYSNVTDPFCTLWAETTVLRCASGYVASDNTCKGSFTNFSSVATTAPALFKVMENECQATSAGSNISVVSATLGKQFFYKLTDKAVCNSTLLERSIAQGLGRPDPPMTLWTFAWMSYMSHFQTRLRTLELIAYGSMPNGIKTEVRTLGYSPGSEFGYDTSTMSSECMRGYWLSVSPETLPITSLTFDSTSKKEEEVVVDIVAAPSCQAEANKTSSCYVVKNSDLRVNYVFQDSNGVNIPPALAVIGDVTSPLFSGLYDVPASLIETTRNTLVRSNLLTYLLMPAGTQTTHSFEEFNRLSSGLYDAYAGSASASEYKFPVVLDNEGYPVCNIASGLPVATTYTPPVDNCVPPFVWSGVDFLTTKNNRYTLAPPANGTGCPALVPEPLPGISDKTEFPSRAELLFTRLKPGVNQADPTTSNLQVYGTKSYQYGFGSPGTGPPGFTVSAWVTRTAAVPWEATACTLLEMPVDYGPFAPGESYSLHRVSVILGNDQDEPLKSRFPQLKQTVFVRIDGHTLWVPSASPIDFPLNAPVFISVVFLFGEQAAWNDQIDAANGNVQTAWYRIQLYVNGVLVGSAFRNPVAASYNYHDPVSRGYTEFGTRFQFAAATAALTTTSLDIEHIQFRSWPLSSAAVKQEYKCGLAALTPRCWLPPADRLLLNINGTDVNATQWRPKSSDVPALADRSVAVIALQKSRPACLSVTSAKLLSVGKIYDASQNITQVTNKERGDVYSLTFWMKQVTPPDQPFPIIYEDGNGFYLSDQFVLSVFPAGQAPSYALLNSTVGQTPPNYNAARVAECKEFQLRDPAPTADRSYHFYGISVSGNSATLTINGVAAAYATAGLCGNGTNPERSIYQSLLRRYRSADPLTRKTIQSYKGFWEENSAELMHLYSTALSTAQIAAEMVCQLNSYSISNGADDAIAPQNFALPLAVCTMTDATSSLGYCRHTAMCGGNCAVYALVDRKALTFRAIQVVCDPGWLAPNCVERCKAVDANGQCLSQIQDLTIGSGDMRGLADAYSVNGYWCQILKNYQVAPYSVNGQSFVSLSYRSYQYLADITIPSGKITTVVPRGHCPSLAVQPNGDGSVWILFTNVYAESTRIQIDMKGSQGGECAPPTVCCWGTEYVVIPPFSTKQWVAPSLCSLMRFDVLLDFGNGYESCTTMDATTVAAEIANAESAPVPANIGRNIIGVGNEVIQQLVGVNQGMIEMVFRIVAASLEASRNGANISAILSGAGDAIRDMPNPQPTTPALPPVDNPWKGPIVNETLKGLEDAISAAGDGIDDTGKAILTLDLLNKNYDDLQNSFAASVAAQQVSNDAYRDQLAASNQERLEAIDKMDQAYSDLAYGLSQLRRAMEDKGIIEVDRGETISSAGLGLMITGCVLGTLAAFASAVPLIQQYGPVLARKMSQLRKPKSEADGSGSEGESDDDESGEDSGYETGEELPEDPSPAQVNTAAQAILQARESYLFPHH